MTQPTDQHNEQREQFIEGLRELADWYTEHPDVAAPSYPEMSYCVVGADDTAGCAEVAHVATALGVDVTGDGSSAKAKHSFAGLSFKVFYVSQKRAADWVLLVNAGQAALAQNEPTAPEGGAG